MDAATISGPSWDRLFQLAAPQAGFFTTQQGAEAGYSTQLLLHHIHAGRARRVRRGVYRLVHFPSAPHDDLVPVWLWAEGQGVYSHDTALVLHGLTDVRPKHLHLTLPNAWRGRRLRVPEDIDIHHGDIPRGDRTPFGAVHATSPRRALNECARDSLSPKLLRDAAQRALRRGIVTRPELHDVEEALSPFGGIVE